MRTKSKHWEYEGELRQIFNLNLNNRTNAPYYVNLPSDSIKEIIFGYRCDRAFHVKIRDALRGINLSPSIKQASIHDTDFSLDLKA